MKPQHISGLITAVSASFLIVGCATPGMKTDDTTPATSVQDMRDGPSYAEASHWLCRPDRMDACSVDLDAAVIDVDGSVSVEAFERADDPAFDCFYVYPTVSRDQSVNSDMNAGPEEAAVIAAQFARYGEVCRTYAPLYRQTTLTALLASRAGNDGSPIASLPEGSRDLAYSDVKAAWDYYLANDNDGRGVLLVGHSQGTAMLKRLVAEEIENDPVLDRVIAAHLIGFNVQVPSGAVVGGEFDQMPLCQTSNETGCIIAFSAFAETRPPAARTLFGRSYQDDIDVGCVNPAAPGSTAETTLESYFSNAADGSQAGSWVDGQTIEQRFVKLPGMMSAACVDQDGAQYLSVSINDEGPRNAPSFGPSATDPSMAGVWGLHVVDVHLAMGDLVERAKEQGDAYLSANP